jgi:hypothetical protein
LRGPHQPKLDECRTDPAALVIGVNSDVLEIPHRLLRPHRFQPSPERQAFLCVARKLIDCPVRARLWLCRGAGGPRGGDCGEERGSRCGLTSDRRRAIEPRPAAKPVFSPLRPASRRLLVRALVAPLLWLVALIVVSVTVHRSDAIGKGLLFAAAAFVVSVVVLVYSASRRPRP